MATKKSTPGRQPDSSMSLLKPVTLTPPDFAALAVRAEKLGCSKDQARAAYDEALKAPKWANDLYTVIVHEMEGGITHLSIRRNDRAAARDWRHFQQIKNQLCGAEREGLELYPAESRVVDTVNQFHLWVLPAGQTVPLGFQAGLRSNESGEPGLPVQQRAGEVD